MIRAGIIVVVGVIGLLLLGHYAANGRHNSAVRKPAATAAVLNVEVPAGWVLVHRERISGDEIIIIVRDGIECVIWDSHRAGGIDCDWPMER